ncbi:MAG: sulfurtransferase TusA family protein [Pseudomonadota bacterium]
MADPQPETVHLDTTGLICPLPILRAKKAIKSVPPGGRLEVLATDPGAQPDFRTFCEVTGHALVLEEENEGVFRFIIQT